MTLLVDIGHLCDHHVDDVIEHLCKAQGEETLDVWAPHPNPLVRRIAQVFTDKGLRRSEALTRELSAWLAGDRHKPEMARQPRPEGAMERWSPAELDLVRTYLQALRPSDFTLDDWLCVVDYLVQRYLPTSDLRTEAEWLASRSALMGRIAAAMGDVDEARADTLLTRLPPVQDAGVLGLTPEMRAVLDFGRARCCDRVVSISEQARMRMRAIVVDHQEAVYLGDRAGASESIQSKLLDSEGLLNRDWRRIAITEATENVNQGFIASCKPGTKVRRVERYAGACDFCRSINGAVLTVVEPTRAEKSDDKNVWVGKTNADRSASPRKRTPLGLVERDPHEMWTIPAGAVHPHCRGAWVAASTASGDPTFDAWLAAQRESRR